MTLAILFNLVSLYYILPYLIWLAVAVAVVHYLVWHFNQLKVKPLARRVMKAYKEGVLGKMNVIDPNKYIVSSPAWLSMAGNTMIFIAVIMSGVAFISNKLDSTQTWILPAISFAALTISFALQAFFIRPCGYIKPTIEVIRILQEEDKLKNSLPD